MFAHGHPEVSSFLVTPNYARIVQRRMNVTVDTLVRIANALEVEMVALFKRPKSFKVHTGRPPDRRVEQQSFAHVIKGGPRIANY
jgi:hypothetical protein